MVMRAKYGYRHCLSGEIKKWRWKRETVVIQITMAKYGYRPCPSMTVKVRE